MVNEVSTLKKQTIRLKLLNELSTNLQDLLKSESFFQEVVNLVQSKFHFFALSIWSVDQTDGSTLQLEAQAGAHAQHIKIGHKHRLGILGHVVRSRKSYLANDLSKDPYYSTASIPVISQSELTVPVIKDGVLTAVINVESDHKAAFDEDDVITIEAVAGQIAVALANQKLYAETRKFNLTLQKTVEEKTLELRKAHEQILEQQHQLQTENKALKNLVRAEEKDGNLVGEIIGKSPALSSLILMVDKIAPTSATVLIQGESGTGKELIARKLHFQSERSDKPYIIVNCGALHENLLESELFGHEKGSFTGAVAQKMGLCELANDGTIFLDEIGELPLQLQAKLLRFLQEGEFYRIGGKRPIQVNVRVVSATNRDLEVEVSEGRFREDLFYRLNTITLRMPPLRKRKEDIEALVAHFTKGAYQIEPRVTDALMTYEWPGNIRELQNTMERLKILSERNEIRFEDLPANIKAAVESPVAAAPGGPAGVPTPGLPLEQVERSHILKTLDHFQGNKTKAAQSLGITIKTLYNKLHRYEAGASASLAE